MRRGVWCGEAAVRYEALHGASKLVVGVLEVGAGRGGRTGGGRRGDSGSYMHYRGADRYQGMQTRGVGKDEPAEEEDANGAATTDSAEE